MRGDFCPGARYTVARAAEQLINDELGIVTYLNGSPAAVLSFEIDAAHIRSVYRILNPEKLKNIPGVPKGKSVALAQETTFAQEVPYLHRRLPMQRERVQAAKD